MDRGGSSLWLAASASGRPFPLIAIYDMIGQWLQQPVYLALHFVLWLVAGDSTNPKWHCSLLCSLCSALCALLYGLSAVYALCVRLTLACTVSSFRLIFEWAVHPGSYHLHLQYCIPESSWIVTPRRRFFCRWWYIMSCSVHTLPVASYSSWDR